MYIPQFVRFLYSGPAALKLKFDFAYKNDPRDIASISHDPLLFSQTGEHTYAVMHGDVPLISYDLTTLNRVRDEWNTFAMNWVKGFVGTGIVLCAGSVYHLRSSSYHFNSCVIGALAAAGLALVTLQRLSQLHRVVGPAILQQTFIRYNRDRKEVFAKGIQIIPVEATAYYRFNAKSTSKEHLFLFMQYCRNFYSFSDDSKFYEPLATVVQLLDSSQYATEQGKKHAEALSRALIHVSKEDQITHAFACVPSTGLFEVVVSLRKTGFKDPSSLQSTLNKMFDVMNSDELEATKEWFVQQVEAIENETIKSSLLDCLKLETKEQDTSLDDSFL